MTENLSVALIGYGHFGRYHAEKIAALPGVTFAGIVDSEAEQLRAAEAKFGVPCSRDYRDFLGKVQAVNIVVPTPHHCEIASAFLCSGADVLVEKPLASDLDSARALVALAAKENRILQVGHLERFTGMVELLRRHLTRPLFIESTRIAPFRPRGTDVSVILDLMIHDLDLVLSFLGSPIVSLEAAGGPVFSENEDIANARITFASGCIANITASRISFKTERKMRIFQPDSYLTLDFAGRRLTSISNPSGKPPGGIGDVKIEEESCGEGDPLRKEIESFIDSVRRRVRPVVSGEDGLLALEAAVRVDESLRAHANFVARAAGAEA
jgi:predicted dehydrogenase